MKKTAIIFAVCLLLCVALCSCTMEPETPYYRYCLNAVWECEGNRISFTEATVADTYLAPDGTAYSKDGNVLLITRCKAIMAPEWHIDFVILHGPGSGFKSICDPIPEVSDSGEETLIYLFTIQKEEYTGNILDYDLSVNLVSGEANRLETFCFYEWSPE